MAETVVPVGAPTPVMDVVAPPVEKDAKQADPVDALAAADKRAQRTAADHAPAGKTDIMKRPKPAPAKPEEVAGSGVGMAIAATVIIVFGLAILAVYAYIQTNK